MATFPNSVARVWPLWLEGRCQASNVKVVVGDLFATPNLLKSHTERNLLSPYSNIRAVTSKLLRVSESKRVGHRSRTMSRRLDYTQIAPVGVKGSHLSLISQPETVAERPRCGHAHRRGVRF
jgi:hypothetical protein